MGVLASLQSSLLHWYDKNGRRMMWRASAAHFANPYHVWLSEIMLQQTTVKTVTPYFERFISRFPDIHSLASASRDDVLLLWQGLGYYNRAHRLHETAGVIVSHWGGHFPQNEKDLRSLAGIGDYTAAAIATIAFNKRAAVVDGNVRRVLTRLFARDEVMTLNNRWLRRIALRLTPTIRCASYVQALMDLGAMICTARSPSCSECPLRSSCRAYKMQRQGDFPKLPLKKKRPHRYGLFFLCFNEEGAILLQRKKEGNLLGGTMLLPSTPWRLQEWSLAQKDEWHRHAPTRADQWRLLSGSVRHVFTHFSLDATIVVGKTKKRTQEGLWMLPQERSRYPFSTLMSRLLEHGAVGRG